MSRAVGVTTGAALIAGLSVVALAPGALASDEDADRAPAPVSQEAAESTAPAAEAAPPVESVTDEAPAEEPSVAEKATEAEPAESQPAESKPAESQPSETVDATVSCPGLDDDTDYRTLFSYQYFAGNADDGYVLLGSTENWQGRVGVRALDRGYDGSLDNMMIRAVVALKDGVDISAGGCEYDFSLAAYETEGPSFATSGQQVLLSHDTDTITVDRTEVTLVVDPAECFGQSDLYKTDTVYDGADAPRGPLTPGGKGYSPISADGNIIAVWFGGFGCEEPTPTPTATEPTATPTEPGTVEPTPTATEPTATPTEPGTVEPTATATTPAAGATTPASQPRALARTGVEMWTVALVAALLLGAGGALVALGGSTPRGRRQA